jgi:hypothetical protein
LPKGFEIAVFQNWYLAFRKPAKMDLCLTFKNSVMAASLQERALPLPTVMQTAVPSTEAMDCSTRVCGGRLLTALVVAPFLHVLQSIQ